MKLPNAERIGDHLLFIFEVLSEQDEPLLAGKVHQTLSDSAILPSHYVPNGITPLMLELMFELKMVEVVMVKNPANEALPELRAYRAIDGGFDMFDYNEIDNIDFVELENRIANNRLARQTERQQIATQKRIADLQKGLTKLDKAITRKRLAIKRKKAEIANFRERLAEGVARAETAGAHERAIGDKVRMEIELKELRAKRRDVVSEQKLLLEQ